MPGLAAHASSPGLDQLRIALSTLGAPSSDPCTWHADSGGTVLAVIPDPTPLIKRAATRLWPGPVTLTIELSDAARRAVHTLLGPRVADDDHALWARVPDHTAVRRFLQQAGPVVARGIPDENGGLCSALTDARARLTSAGIRFTEAPLSTTGAIGEGSGIPSTLVRLPRSGGFKVERIGAMSAETVRRRLTLQMLFVCTGNTCRSPMAERIARHLIERRSPGAFPIEVASAGVTASAGEPTTHEALEALRRRGIEARASGARPLDHATLRWADEVFVMTAAHLREAQRQGAQNARLLDPRGGDVPDPIGGTQRQYDDTASRLADLIAARLQEFST